MKAKSIIHLIKYKLLFIMTVTSVILLIAAIVYSTNHKRSFTTIESVPILFDQDSLSFSENGQFQIYQTEVSLETGDAFDLRFDLHGGDADGGLLFIDLYADRYDLEEAECRYSVTKDTYSVNRILHFGNQHPQKCMFRVFSTGDVSALVDNIHLERLHYSVNGIGIVALVCVVITSLMLVLAGFGNNSKKQRMLLLFGVILLQCLTMFYWLSQKTNCYVDELYSLNGAHRFTSVSADTGYIYEQWNRNVVNTGELKQRLAVNEGESVLDQPLIKQVYSFFEGRNYYWILNIVETLAGRGYIHVIPPIVLNVFFVIATELLLYMLLKHIGTEEGFSLLGVMWYGYSGMTVSNAMYIRVYTFAVLLFVLLLYLHARIWNSNRIREWICTEILSVLTIYIGYKDSELILPLAAIMISFFSIGLLVRRRWKQFFIYSVPLILAGAIMICIISPALDMLLHSGAYISRALEFAGVGDIDRTEEMMYLVRFSNPETFMKKMHQCMQLLGNYLFGNTVMMLGVLFAIIALGVLCLCQKRKYSIKTKKGEYEGYILIMFFLFVLYTFFSSVALNVVLRYYSYVSPLVIILVVYTMNKFKPLARQFALGMSVGIVTISCILIHASSNIEYLYFGDERLHNMLRNYQETESLLIVDVPSFQRSVYEAVVNMNEKATLRQIKMVNGVAEDTEGMIKEKELPDTLLLWSFPDRKISEHLQWISDNGFQYEVLGSNSAAEVYVCERKI